MKDCEERQFMAEDEKVEPKRRPAAWGGVNNSE